MNCDCPIYLGDVCGYDIWTSSSPSQYHIDTRQKLSNNMRHEDYDVKFHVRKNMYMIIFFFVCHMYCAN
jgi:hypothetical protein